MRRLREFFRNLFSTPEERTEREAQSLIDEANTEIDERLQRYDLPADLPEIAELRKAVAKLARSEHDLDRRTIGLLVKSVNPTEWFYIREDGTPVLPERMFGGVLKPWTVVTHHIGFHKEHVARIVVDKIGTTLLNRDDEIIVIYGAGVCDPHRLADPGNRLENAGALISHYTNGAINIGIDELWQKYSASVVRDDAGTWSYTTSTDPETAHLSLA